MKSKLLLLVLLLPLMAGAQTYTYSTLANFPASSDLGPSDPTSPLLIDQQGNLFGTSQAGYGREQRWNRIHGDPGWRYHHSPQL